MEADLIKENGKLPRELSSLLWAIMENPYAKDKDEWDESYDKVKDILQPMSIEKAVRIADSLAENGKVELARAFLLTVKLCKSYLSTKAQGVALDNWGNEQPRYSEHLRLNVISSIVHAFVLVMERIEYIAGTSDSVNTVKSQIWSLCFGGTLLEMVRIGSPVVRDIHVLICGETGVGKELVAQAILAGTVASDWSSNPKQLTFSAAAIPPSLSETELFGHKAGAFTGAKKARDGKILAAHKGSLFIDEVAELGPSTQAQLLRCMQEKKVQSVGVDSAYENADVRYIGATLVDLRENYKTQTLRQDLYERFAGFVIHVPPLRERREDILDIALATHSKIYGTLGSTQPLPYSIDVLESWLSSPSICQREWRGNARELQRAIRLWMLGIASETSMPSSGIGYATGADFPEALQRIARCDWTEHYLRGWYIDRMVNECDGNQTAAAGRLGVDRGKVARWQEIWKKQDVEN